MSNNTQTKVTNCQVAVAVFNSVLPHKDTIGNRAFRTLVLAKLRSMFAYNSVPVMYNFAKKQATVNGLCDDFAKSAGQNVGKRVELDPKVEEEINIAMDKAIAIATGKETVAIQANMKWQIINKETGNVVDYAETRKKAYAKRDGNKELSVKAL